MTDSDIAAVAERKVAAGGRHGDPRCPTCSCKLEWVGSGPGWMNREQWDASKAGEFFLSADRCARADCSGRRHSNGNRYWNDIEPPKPVDWKARAEAAESRLEAMSALVEACRPFARKAAKHEVAHSAGYDYRPHENNMVTHRLADFRAIADALAEVEKGSPSGAGACGGNPPSPRPSPAGGREP